MTETMGLLMGCVLLIALFLYTFWPENGFAGQTDKTRLEYLLERKEQLYENLRDLNFEYKAGKVPEGDFRSMRSSLEEEATAILSEIVRLEVVAASSMSYDSFGAGTGAQ